jgi:hypothetical protein
MATPGRASANVTRSAVVVLMRRSVPDRRGLAGGAPLRSSGRPGQDSCCHCRPGSAMLGSLSGGVVQCETP